jgi:DNA-binding transcriptional MerR regulator
MTDYRIDDLAQKAGTTVRNIRAYQERGLLPPPRREGRAGLFGDVHLSRLRLIGQLLERGYTLANIGELFTAWENGHAIEQLLGAWPDGSPLAGQELPTHVTAEWLAEAFRGILPVEEIPNALSAALDLGILVPAGDRFRVADPRLLRVAAELVAAGVPPKALERHAHLLRGDVERIARRFVDLVTENVFEPSVGSLANPAEATKLAQLAQRLRPLADIVVLSELGRAMDREASQRIQEYLVRALNHREL